MKKVILGMVFVFFTIIIINANNNQIKKEMYGSVTCYEQADSHLAIEAWYYEMTYEEAYYVWMEEYDNCTSDGRQDEIQFP